MEHRWVLRSFVLAVVAAVLLSVPAGSATAGEKKWRVRLMGAFAGDQDGVVITSDDHSFTGVMIDGGIGGGINFEYRYSQRMGFEMGVMAVGGRVRVGWVDGLRHHRAGVEVGSYVPFTFAFNYHPLKNSGGFDLFVGPLMASTIHTRVGVSGQAIIQTKVDFGLGVNLGADIDLGQSRWSINTGFKYISNLTDSSGGDARMAFDPLIFTLGIGFKF